MAAVGKGENIFLLKAPFTDGAKMSADLQALRDVADNVSYDARRGEYAILNPTMDFLTVVKNLGLGDAEPAPRDREFPEFPEFSKG